MWRLVSMKVRSEGTFTLPLALPTAGTGSVHARLAHTQLLLRSGDYKDLALSYTCVFPFSSLREPSQPKNSEPT